MSSKIIFFLFLIILLFQTIINQNCGETNTFPAKRNDCFRFSNETFYCCYKDGECSPQNKSKIEEGYDCGITEDNYGKYEFQQYHPKIDTDIGKIGFQTCGKKIPEKPKDCHIYSEITNGCCFFKIKDKDDKACFFIGRGIDKKHLKSNFSHDGIEIDFDCNSFKISFNYILILLIIFLL